MVQNKEIIPDRRTVGDYAAELMAKQPESQDPIEIERAMQQDYLDNLKECVLEFRRNHRSSFFVVVITKNEPLLHNVFRNYFSARVSCPTPDYDQSVYKYNAIDESIEYIWTIPTREVCKYLKKHALEVHHSEQQLLKFVLDFADGSLFRLSKKLNRETDDSALLAT